MDNNKAEKEKYIKLNFLKKVWYCISKFEKYPEMAALGVGKAISYFSCLILLFSIIYTLIITFYINNIKEFDEPNLNFSQKVVKVLIEEDENQEQIVELTDSLLEESKTSTNVTIFISIFIAFFMTFYMTTLLDVLTLSVFGIVTCAIAKIKMNYKAIFNMSIFALTLPIILRIIYVALNVLANFEIKYFEVMYVAVSYISLAAAIFLIKSDVIKQHLQLMKILEESKEKIEETIIPKKPKEENDEDKDDEKEEKKEEKNGTEEQGSNA